jgi:hypothetical protein
MDKLDSLVLDAFKQRIYSSEYIRSVIDELRRHAQKMEGNDSKQRLKKLEQALQEAEQAQARLYDAVEKGLIEQDEQLKIRFQQNKTKREGLLSEIAVIKKQRQSPLAVITPQKIETVAKVLNKKLSESLPFAKAYLKATLSEIRITGETVSLSGENSSMASLIAANGQIEAQNQVGSTSKSGALGKSN